MYMYLSENFRDYTVFHFVVTLLIFYKKKEKKTIPSKNYYTGNPLNGKTYAGGCTAANEPIMGRTTEHTIVDRNSVSLNQFYVNVKD